DGIRDFHVTGVQTCALPISREVGRIQVGYSSERGTEAIYGRGTGLSIKRRLRREVEGVGICTEIVIERNVSCGRHRLLRQAGKQLPASAKSKKSMLKQLRYFANNAPQMRYAEYREKKFFVGSGVVEAGCRTVIGERLKQSGMRWSVRGANAIIALRCCILSGRFEDFWASRTP